MVRKMCVENCEEEANHSRKGRRKIKMNETRKKKSWWRERAAGQQLCCCSAPSIDHVVVS